MKEVKTILFRYELNGRGIVNYDETSLQKKLINKFDYLSHLRHHANNITYAKKELLDDDYKIKISSNSLRKALFEKYIIAHTPEVSLDDTLLFSTLATPVSLLRGYMFLSKKNENLKRKGAISITDAIQTNTAKSKLEVFVRSGKKETKDVELDTSDNTFFVKETVGDITYGGRGFLDLRTLQFVPCDDIFDRFQFNPDRYQMFKKFLKLNLPNFDNDLGYYMYNTSSYRLPERGLFLTNEQVLFLTKEFFKLLVSLEMRKSNGFAEISKIEYKLVTTPSIETFNDNNGWIELRNHNDVESIDFSMHEFYSLVDNKEALDVRENLKAIQDRKKELDIEQTKLAKEETKKKKTEKMKN